jgi:peroxiredoxin
MLTAAWVALTSLAAHAVEVGSPAPDFSGTSTQGTIRLSDLRGQKVVLAFYFADFTPV